MYKSLALSLIAGAAALTLGIGQAAQAASTLKVSTCLPKNHDQNEAYFEVFHNPINAMNGAVKLQYLGGPEVTPQSKQAPALKRGLVDMIVCPSAYYVGLVPEARLVILSPVSIERLRENGAFDLLNEAWSKGLNAKILGWGYWGGADFHIYTTEEPKQNDKTGISLEGLKIRSIASYVPFLKAMGATPVTIAAGEVYTALERGLVQGLAWPEGAVAKFGWHKFLKYRVYPGFFRSSTMILINQDKFNKLPKDAQDLLVREGLKFEKTSGPVLRKKADIDNAKLFAAGMNKVELKGAAREAYIDTVYGRVWDDNAKRKYSVDFTALRKKMLDK